MIEQLAWVAVTVAIASLIAWRLTYAAVRLDRLHARVEGTLAALDAQLVRRAEASLELARSGELDRVPSLLLGAAATDSLERSDEATIIDEVREHGLGREREETENALTAALLDALAPRTVRDLNERAGPGAGCLAVVHNAAQRVQLSRRFHNDAVRDVRRVRRGRLVRWFHLAGRTDLPCTIEFDDTVPDVRPHSPGGPAPDGAA